jgi:hypothetical protein
MFHVKLTNSCYRHDCISRHKSTYLINTLTPFYLKNHCRRIIHICSEFVCTILSQAGKRCFLYNRESTKMHCTLVIAVFFRVYIPLNWLIDILAIIMTKNMFMQTVKRFFLCLCINTWWHVTYNNEVTVTITGVVFYAHAMKSRGRAY